jgi:hypothetical protein
VELALAIPAVVLLLAIALAAGAAAVAQIGCADAARAASRAAALGQDPAAIADQVTARLGPGAGVSLSAQGDLLRVTVTRPAPAGVARWVGARSISATAVAACEPFRGCGQ